VAGRATADGTARYAARHAHRFAVDFYRPLAAGLAVGSLGMGSYLGECDDADDARYAAAARAALGGGANLLDTAINYRCQRSERAVGAALAGAVAAGEVRRDEVVLCSKGGYLPLDGAPPASRAEYLAYVEREYHAPGVMAAADVVSAGHCIAPSFLADQFARSRANLGVEAIDVYYLHNPEQQLEALTHERFRDAVRRAFAVLESRAAAGELVTYGCATWGGFRVPPGAPGHLSLAELVQLAREAAGGGAHHFGVVQLPVNLGMTEAVRARTQRLPGSREVTLLEAAAELGVAVVASASLMQAQLATGLPPQLRHAFPALATDAQRALAFARALPVAAALVGMRSPEHVEENLAAGTV
jgi:aryl-alcohol dehydrogenase-like predicted oxidoreductase